MPWVRVDSNAPLHPKIVGLGPAGFGFFVASLCYANHFLTDGFIPVAALVAVFPGITERRALGLAVKLVEANLWEKQETPPGWRIHDYSSYQFLRENVEAARNATHRVKVLAGMARARNAARLGGRFTSTTTSTPPAGDQQTTSPMLHTHTHTHTEKKRDSTRRVVLADDTFIAALKENPAYKDIDVDRELGKMDAYLLTPRARGRQKTRGFIVNWLNRADRPLVSVSSAARAAGRHPNHSQTCECERCYGQ